MYDINSAEEFYRLRTSKDPKEYYVATHGTASAEVWLSVIESFPEMKKWIAFNKPVPMEILELLSKDVDENVRVEVARRGKISQELFEQLAVDPSWRVRMCIARNRKVPKSILESLSHDQDEDVKSAASSLLSRCDVLGVPE